MDDIKTDVDRLMEVLAHAPGKTFEMAELREQLGMTTAQLKHWISVLEGTGQVRVRYSLTREQVEWTGRSRAIHPAEARMHLGRGHQETGEEQADLAAPESIPSPEVEKTPSHVPDEETGSYYNLAKTGEHIAKPAVHRPSESVTDELAALEAARAAQERYDQEMEAQEEKVRARVKQQQEASARLRAEYENKLKAIEGKLGDEGNVKRDTNKEREMSVSSKPALVSSIEDHSTERVEYSDEGILNALKAAQTSSIERVETMPSHERAETVHSGASTQTSVSVPLVVSRGKPAKKSSSRMQLARIEPVVFPTLPGVGAMPKPDDKQAQFNHKLTSAMNRIKAKADEVQTLQEKRKQLLRDVYRPMQRKMEHETEAVSDQLLKYENRLLKLRERLAQLPQEVADAGVRQEKLNAVSSEMQHIYDETTHLMEETLNAVVESRQNAELKMESLQSGISQQEGYLSQLAGMVGNVSTSQAETEARLELARGALEEEQARLNSAQEQLARVGGMKATLEGEMEAVRGDLKMQKAALHDMNTHLSRVENVQKWVTENRAEYDKRMRDLAEYIAGADEEYATLRESVEAGFVRKYLRELRGLAESHEFELAQAEQGEEMVEQQIAQAKSELASLVAQAKRIAYLQEMQLDEDEEHRKTVARRALGREAMFNSLSVQDKSRQKARMLIRSVIEGAPDEKKEDSDLSIAIPRLMTGPKRTRRKQTAARKISKSGKNSKKKNTRR